MKSVKYYHFVFHLEASNISIISVTSCDVFYVVGVVYHSIHLKSGEI